MHILSPLTITTTNTHSIISTPQVEFEEDGVYAALPLPCKGIEEAMLKTKKRIIVTTTI